MKFASGIMIAPGQKANQEIILLNDGQAPWPEDTTLVFQDMKNLFGVPENMHVGDVSPGNSFRFELTIKMPNKELTEKQTVTYELCYNKESQSIGSPIKFNVAQKTSSKAIDWSLEQ